jgi:Phosphoribosyl transferase domain
MAGTLRWPVQRWPRTCGILVEHAFGGRLTINLNVPSFRPHAERLHAHSVRQHRTTGEVRLYLSCPAYVSAQVRTMLSSHAPRRLLITSLQDAAQWTDRYSLDSLPTERERAALRLLEAVVTVEPRPGLDIAIALDYYTEPESDPDPMQWKKTPAGEMVRKAKYQKAAGALDELANELVGVVRRHPLMSGCEAVLSVPGHDAVKVSFSEQLAQAVARGLGVQFVRTSARRASRPQAKEIGDADDLSDEFTVSEVVRGRPVLIVDDVIMSARSLAAVAQAARRAGAVGVCGIAGAKTLKKQARDGS